MINTSSETWNYKESLETVSDLYQLENVEIGDLYFVKSTGAMYVFKDAGEPTLLSDPDVEALKKNCSTICDSVSDVEQLLEQIFNAEEFVFKGLIHESDIKSINPNQRDTYILIESSEPIVWYADRWISLNDIIKFREGKGGYF